MNNTKMLVLSALVAVFAGAVAANDMVWRLFETEAGRENNPYHPAVTNAYAWINPDNQNEHSGVDGAPLDPAKRYWVTANQILYTLPGTPNNYGTTPEHTTVFLGKSLTLGRIRQTTSGAAKTSWDNWGVGEGLILRDPGYYTMYASGEANIYGKIKVETSAENPYVIMFQHSDSCLDFHGDFSGAADTGLLIGGGQYQRITFKVSGSLTNYLGGIVATNVDFRATTTTLAGELSMKWATLSALATNDIFTIGTLTLGEGAKLAVCADAARLGAGIIAITNQLNILASPAIVTVPSECMEGVTNVVTLPLLTAAAGVNLGEQDFRIAADAPAGARLLFTVDEGTGVKTLSIRLAPVVMHLADDKNYRDLVEYGSNIPYTSSFDYDDNWSDGKKPHAHAHYQVERLDGASVWHLRTPVDNVFDYVFPGETLSLGYNCRFGLFYKSFFCNELRMTDGAHFMLGQGVQSGKLDGRLVVPDSGSVYLCAYNGATFEIAADVVGAARLIFDGSHGNTSNRRAFTRLTGDNSRFRGTITVGLNRNPQMLSDNMFQTFYVADAAKLGAPLPVFDATSLVLKRLARLYADGSVAFADTTRGVYVGEDGSLLGSSTGVNTYGTDGDGQFYVEDGETLALRTQLTLNGHLHKMGNGTLALGGVLKFGPANAIVDTPLANSNLVSVTEGYVKPLAVDAFNGMKMTFAAGAGIKLDINPVDADLVTYGLRNAKELTPIATADADGSIAVSFDVPDSFAPTKSFVVGIVTLPANQAEAVRAKLEVENPQIPDHSMAITLNPTGELVTIQAEFRQTGLSIYLR